MMPEKPQSFIEKPSTPLGGQNISAAKLSPEQLSARLISDSSGKNALILANRATLPLSLAANELKTLNSLLDTRQTVALKITPTHLELQANSTSIGKVFLSRPAAQQLISQSLSLHEQNTPYGKIIRSDGQASANQLSIGRFQFVLPPSWLNQSTGDKDKPITLLLLKKSSSPIRWFLQTLNGQQKIDLDELLSAKVQQQTLTLAGKNFDLKKDFALGNLKAGEYRLQLSKDTLQLHAIEDFKSAKPIQVAKYQLSSSVLKHLEDVLNPLNKGVHLLKPVQIEKQETQAQLFFNLAGQRHQLTLNPSQVAKFDGAPLIVSVFLNGEQSQLVTAKNETIPFIVAQRQILQGYFKQLANSPIEQQVNELNKLADLMPAETKNHLRQTIAQISQLAKNSKHQVAIHYTLNADLSVAIKYDKLATVKVPLTDELKNLLASHQLMPIPTATQTSHDADISDDGLLSQWHSKQASQHLLPIKNELLRWLKNVPASAAQLTPVLQALLAADNQSLSDSQKQQLYTVTRAETVSVAETLSHQILAQLTFNQLAVGAPETKNSQNLVAQLLNLLQRLGQKQKSTGQIKSAVQGLQQNFVKSVLSQLNDGQQFHATLPLADGDHLAQLDVLIDNTPVSDESESEPIKMVKVSLRFNFSQDEKMLVKGVLLQNALRLHIYTENETMQQRCKAHQEALERAFRGSHLQLEAIEYSIGKVLDELSPQQIQIRHYQT